MSKLNAIIFGASQGGENFIKRQNEYRILAIADNDRKKVNQKLQGILIISPSDIMKFTYDLIIITSMYYNPILKQLLELGCKKEKIIAAPKSYLKSATNPFEDEKTIKFAIEILQRITELLYNFKIQYYVDFGTLLGIVRDGSLITWDDDIDLSIRSDQLQDLLNYLNPIVNGLSPDAKWYYDIIYNKDNTVSNITLRFKSISDVSPFSIDIWILYFQDGLAIQTMNKAPAIHFLDYEVIMFKGKKISVPYQYVKYLEHTYGDWKTPKKDSTFADYPFAFNE